MLKYCVREGSMIFFLFLFGAVYEWWSIFAIEKSTFFSSIQSLFGSWLADKEKALSEVQTSDFKDPSEINASVRRLAVSRQTCIISYLEVFITCP